MQHKAKEIRNIIILVGIVFLLMGFFFKPFIIAIRWVFWITHQLCGFLPCSATGSMFITAIIYLIVLFVLGTLVGKIAESK